MHTFRHFRITSINLTTRKKHIELLYFQMTKPNTGNLTQHTIWNRIYIKKAYWGI